MLEIKKTNSNKEESTIKIRKYSEVKNMKIVHKLVGSRKNSTERKGIYLSIYVRKIKQENKLVKVKKSQCKESKKNKDNKIEIEY